MRFTQNTFKQRAKQRALHKLVRVGQDLLINSDRAYIARRYLNSRIDKEAQMSWKFGYFPPDDHLDDLLSMMDKDELEALKLVYPKYLQGGTAPHGHFAEHNLIMPFCNEYGDIVSIVGRCLLSEKIRQELEMNKYTYSSGRRDLFVYGIEKAMNSIIEKDYVIGVEGQFDCISLHERGITNVVAFGWSHLSRYQFWQIHRYTNNIVVMFDNDEAGQRGRKAIREKFKDAANIKAISPPKPYKDIDEFFRGSKDNIYIQHVIDKLKNMSFGSIDGQKDE